MTTSRDPRRTHHFAVAAIGVAAVAFAALAAGGIGGNLVYYWGPSELHAAGPKAVGATIRLGGQVAPGSVLYGAGSALEFDVVDGRSSVRVHSTGVPPQMFREGIGVVVEGTMAPSGLFQSRRLMVSHGNEYRAPRAGETVDPRALMQTTTGIAADSGARR